MQQHPARGANRRHVVVLVGYVRVRVILPRLFLRRRHAHVPDGPVDGVLHPVSKQRSQLRVLDEAHDELQQLRDDGLEGEFLALVVPRRFVLVRFVPNRRRVIRGRERVEKPRRRPQRRHQRVPRALGEVLDHLRQAPEGFEDEAALSRVRRVRRGGERCGEDVQPRSQQRRHQVPHRALPRAGHDAQGEEARVEHREGAALDREGVRRRVRRDDGAQFGQQRGNRVLHLRLLHVAEDHREASKGAGDGILARSLADGTHELCGELRPLLRPVPRGDGGDGHAARGSDLSLRIGESVWEELADGGFLVVARLRREELALALLPVLLDVLLEHHRRELPGARRNLPVQRAAHQREAEARHRSALREMLLGVHARGFVGADARLEDASDLVLHLATVGFKARDVAIRLRRPRMGRASLSPRSDRGSVSKTRDSRFESSLAR